MMTRMLKSYLKLERVLIRMGEKVSFVFNARHTQIFGEEEAREQNNETIIYL